MNSSDVVVVVLVKKDNLDRKKGTDTAFIPILVTREGE